MPRPRSPCPSVYGVSTSYLKTGSTTTLPDAIQAEPSFLNASSDILQTEEAVFVSPEPRFIPTTANDIMRYDRNAKSHAMMQVEVYLFSRLLMTSCVEILRPRIMVSRSTWLIIRSSSKFYITLKHGQPLKFLNKGHSTLRMDGACTSRRSSVLPPRRNGMFHCRRLRSRADTILQKTLTEVDVCNMTVLADIEHFRRTLYDDLRRAILDRMINLELEDVELVLEPKTDDYGVLCSYYFVHRRKRCLFWLEAFDAPSIFGDCKGVKALSHKRSSHLPTVYQRLMVYPGLAIEAQYWYAT